MMTIQELQQEIINLNSRFTCTTSDIGDWKVAKCTEYQLLGKELPYDIEELGAARQAVRDEINLIQERIAELELQEQEADVE
ncbi:MAG: hypothetical protein J1E62_06575 [Lachnospiraceae bacterium]|nr:hypothetical protein [Lachnospiraceae bacterium]